MPEDKPPETAGYQVAPDQQLGAPSYPVVPHQPSSVPNPLGGQGFGGFQPTACQFEAASAGTFGEFDKAALQAKGYVFPPNQGSGGKKEFERAHFGETRAFRYDFDGRLLPDDDADPAARR